MPRKKGCRLFDSATWSLVMPDPFDDSSVTARRTDAISKYNVQDTKKASTIHPLVMAAVLSYLELDKAQEIGGTAPGAIGTQGSEASVVEYASRTGEFHAALYNSLTGKFRASVFASAEAAPGSYGVAAGKQTGTALLLALLPFAMADSEFAGAYAKLKDLSKTGDLISEEGQQAAALLCDNLYRRVEYPTDAGSACILTDIPASGNIPSLTKLNLDNGSYTPSSVLYGEFQILTAAPATPVTAPVKKEDFVGKYTFRARTLTAEEQGLVPGLPDWYVIPDDIRRVCLHIRETTSSTVPMRNFLFRGPGGTGKTEGVKAIAAAVGLPYVSICLSANTEIIDLVGQIIPAVSTKGENAAGTALPTLEDIQMDPASAMAVMTGAYDPEVTADAVYEKLIETIRTQAEQQSAEEKAQPSSPRFRFVETPLIKAITNGWVLEIQEPGIVSNPGVLVGLNALLDNTRSLLLPTGETIRRHSDSIIIMTTNTDYEGCRPMNQSILSRMNLILDEQLPAAEEMAKRVLRVTGCKDAALVRQMAKCVEDIDKYCSENAIRDGCCGVRALISWVQSYMVCGNAEEAAKYTVLAAATSSPESLQDIQDAVSFRFSV